MEATKITMILTFENKKKVVRSKHSSKRRSKKVNVLIKKRRVKGEKYITPMGFAEYLRKLDVSENSKVYYSRFLQNGLLEMYCY